MVDKEYILKEVSLIQDIIKRMASNSFMIKAWTVTLVVVTLLLKGDNDKIFVAFIPLLVFWFLDAYYLWQERIYRELYKWVIANRQNTDEKLLDMNAVRFKDKVQPIIGVMFSVTLRWFYGAIGLLIVAYKFLLAKGG